MNLLAFHMWVCTCSKCLDILTWDELVLVTGTPRKQVRVHSEELSTALERKKTNQHFKGLFVLLTI